MNKFAIGGVVGVVAPEEVALAALDETEAVAADFEEDDGKVALAVVGKVDDLTADADVVAVKSMVPDFEDNVDEAAVELVLDTPLPEPDGFADVAAAEDEVAEVGKEEGLLVEV